MKIAIQYARQGAARYISHLDMQRTFARAIRRANINAQYSQGFNPHIVMSFASPLSVGYATLADYLEVGVEDGMEPAAMRDALNQVLTADIRIVEVFVLPEGRKKLMSLNHSAAYRITFALENEQEYDKISCAADRLTKAETYLAQDRKGRELDIAPYILQLECKDGGVDTTLQNAATGALNPAVLANALLKEAGLEADYAICRVECFALVNGDAVPFTELGNAMEKE